MPQQLAGGGGSIRIAQKRTQGAFKIHRSPFEDAFEPFLDRSADETDEQEEEYKKQQLEKIERTNSPDKVAKAKDLFLRSHITDKQDKAAGNARAKQGHEEFMKPARLFLSNNTDQELEKPAILDQVNQIEFKEFTTEEKGGMLVRLNPGYFDMKLPKYMPQFLIAYWEWDEGTPQNYWKDQIEKNFDFNALKAMLDK